MTASWYKLELETRHQLENDGYFCTRPGGSKGPADVVAIKRPFVVGAYHEILLVQCKESGIIPPAERRALVELASDLVATAVAARWGHGGPRGGRTVEFRELTGSGPADWRPWTPDHAIGGQS